MPQSCLAHCNEHYLKFFLCLGLLSFNYPPFHSHDLGLVLSFLQFDLLESYSLTLWFNTVFKILETTTWRAHFPHIAFGLKQRAKATAKLSWFFLIFLILSHCSLVMKFATKLFNRSIVFLLWYFNASLSIKFQLI